MAVSSPLSVHPFVIDLCSCVTSSGGLERIDRCCCIKRITRLQKIEWNTRCGLIGTNGSEYLNGNELGWVALHCEIVLVSRLGRHKRNNHVDDRYNYTS